jgi:hypothetical protein
MGRAGWIAGFGTAGIALAVGVAVGIRAVPASSSGDPPAPAVPPPDAAAPAPAASPVFAPPPWPRPDPRRAAVAPAPSPAPELPLAAPDAADASARPPLPPAKVAINEADAAMMAGDPDTADALLLGVIDDPATSVPIRSFALYKRASVLVDLGREDEARAALREVLEAPLGDDKHARWLRDQAAQDLAEME